MEAIEFITSNGYSVVKSVSGDYYRLMNGREVIMEDSACEELYDYDTALALFVDVIKEREAIQYQVNKR